jgi:hypothetical protein
MRILLYLVALLTGLCVVDAGTTASASPVAIGSTLHSEQTSHVHHQAVNGVTANVRATCIQGIVSRNSLPALPVYGFSTSTPVDRVDSALK